MPKYRVTLNEVADYEVIVEAPDEETASEMAETAFVNAKDITEFPCEIHVREVANVEAVDE